MGEQEWEMPDKPKIDKIDDSLANDSNKVLRTLATGQSDITRHEAYTKAQGLNEFNSLTPSYTKEELEFVDLGLPSGTKWAKMNVGANSETDPGLYFAWGETEGYTAEQVGVDKLFAWSDYKFNPSGDGSTFTKYNLTDDETVLDAEDDAAAANMGGEWHMPTDAQRIELFNTEYVTNEQVENYNGSGINGRLFTSVSNGNTMFIPAAGYCEDGRVLNVGGDCNVWTPTLGSKGAIYFDSVGRGIASRLRCVGRSVRGVIDGSEGPLK